MKKLLICLLLLLSAAASRAESDSVRIERMLHSSITMPESTNWMTYFARQLLGVPYVGGTLDVRYAKDKGVRNGEVPVIINIHGLDCYTYVEACTALTFCRKYRKTSFADYRQWITRLRFYEGKPTGYASRLHYVSQWVIENARYSRMREIQGTEAPFTASQRLELTLMSKFPTKYAALTGHPMLIHDIEKRERELKGIVRRYIPRNQLGNTKALRATVKDGDILGIVTNKHGLDCSHVGIAVWHSDGLHLLNASSIHKKTVEEPMTLLQYLSKQPGRIGIRVFRLN